MNPHPPLTPAPVRLGEEVTPMHVVVVAAALAVGVAAAFGVAACRRARAAQRALRLEKGAARLMGAAHHRDMEAFRARLASATADQHTATRHLAEAAVLDAADRVVAAELARTIRRNPQEGDTP